VCVVGGRYTFGFIDVVNAERLEDLGLDEVPNSGLGHHRNGNGRDDAVNHVRIAHPRYAALRTDVGGHSLQSHNGDGARVLSDLGLLGGAHVHDDSALEHLGHATLHAGSAETATRQGAHGGT